MDETLWHTSHCSKWQTGQIKNPHAFDVCSLRSSRAALGCLWPAEFYWGEKAPDPCPEFELPIRLVHLGSFSGASEELNE